MTHRTIICFLFLAILSHVVGCQRAPLTALGRAEMAYRNGDWRSAVAACNELLSSNADHDSALMIRGRAYLALKEFDLAVADFSRLIELKPSDHETYYYRGMAYEGLGQQDLATADRAQGRELDPMRKKAYAYDPSNFIPRSNLKKLIEKNQYSPDKPGSEGASPDSNSTADDSFQLGEDDFAEKDSSWPDQPFPTANRDDRRPEIDEDYVRDAVDDFRRMMTDTKIAKPKPHAGVPSGLPSALPDIGMDPDEFLKPDHPDQNDVAEEGKEKTGSESEAAKISRPALSTALPPGFGPLGGLPTSSGLAYPSTASRPSATPYGGGIPSGAPLGNVVTPIPLPNNPIQVPLANTAGMAGAGQSSLHANPIYTPGTKPVLSTSLPTVAPGSGPVLSPPPVANPYRGLPPMIPQPTARDDY